MHKCFVCGMGFKHEGTYDCDLSNHYKNNSQNDYIFDAPVKVNIHGGCTARKQIENNKIPTSKPCMEAFSKQPLFTSTIRALSNKRFQCTDCLKKFSMYSKLTTHKRTHTGEKLYECSDCQKKCSNQSNLIEHKRTHTGERPYECSDCKK